MGLINNFIGSRLPSVRPSVAGADARSFTSRCSRYLNAALAHRKRHVRSLDTRVSLISLCTTAITREGDARVVRNSRSLGDPEIDALTSSAVRRELRDDRARGGNSSRDTKKTRAFLRKKKNAPPYRQSYGLSLSLSLELYIFFVDFLPQIFHDSSRSFLCSARASSPSRPPRSAMSRTLVHPLLLLFIV